MTVAAKWLGPCEADQKPGDLILPNGMKMNLRDMGKNLPAARAGRRRCQGRWVGWRGIDCAIPGRANTPKPVIARLDRAIQ